MLIHWRLQQSEGQVPLAGGYKVFIRNFQGMYSVCEKQIDWSKQWHASDPQVEDC
jgi:hypothetical protein